MAGGVAPPAMLLRRQEVSSLPSFLDMKGVSKRFPGVVALDNVDFSCRAGEVHALVGENGAGKTTLMNILGGLYRPDAGTISIDGQPVVLCGPADAGSKGIGFVHQEFNLLPNLTVYENVFLSREVSGCMGKLDKAEMRARTVQACKGLGYNLDPDRLLGDLSLAEQQLCEITRAVIAQPRILIMDEPTAALAEDEVRRLFSIVNALKSQGVSVIYISHRLDEVLELADRVTVLKDGGLVGVVPRAELTRDRLISMMVGRTFDDIFPPASNRAHGSQVLAVHDLAVEGKLEPTSLAVAAGEIVGLGGLEGQGQRTLVRAIFGDIAAKGGSVSIDGAPVAARSIKHSIGNGIGYVTCDRRGEGLVLQASVRHNSALASLWSRQRHGFVCRAQEEREVSDSVQKLEIKCRSIDERAALLSGGNQQKVMLARWLMARPKVLILDEPTRGIDVGARVSIYRIIRGLANEGMAIVLLTSDMIELMGLSDRIVVFYEGRVTGEFTREEATEQNIMQAASGLEREAV